jgi:AmmeMemoRadiSam system protein A
MGVTVKPPEDTLKDGEIFFISKDSGRELLSLARKAIVEYIRSGKIINPAAPTDSVLKRAAAVFTTLSKNGALRGCIGTPQPVFPLYKAAVKMSVAAAFGDARFSPVTEEEPDCIKIEISVLSPLRKINDPSEIIPSKHGVLVSKKARSGLFLPQVWRHFNDNTESFMNELCFQKAGLEKDAWKNGAADVCVFSVLSFKER